MNLRKIYEVLNLKIAFKTDIISNIPITIVWQNIKIQNVFNLDLLNLYLHEHIELMYISLKLEIYRFKFDLKRDYMKLEDATKYDLLDLLHL